MNTQQLIDKLESILYDTDKPPMQGRCPACMQMVPFPGHMGGCVAHQMEAASRDWKRRLSNVVVDLKNQAQLDQLTLEREKEANGHIVRNLLDVIRTAHVAFGEQDEERRIRAREQLAEALQQFQPKKQTTSTGRVVPRNNNVSRHVLVARDKLSQPSPPARKSGARKKQP